MREECRTNFHVWWNPHLGYTMNTVRYVQCCFEFSIVRVGMHDVLDACSVHSSDHVHYASNPAITLRTGFHYFLVYWRVGSSAFMEVTGWNHPSPETHIWFLTAVSKLASVVHDWRHATISRVQSFARTEKPQNKQYPPLEWGNHDFIHSKVQNEGIVN